MQVKKFEARTMKEALELVKMHLGPDAIILSARDNKKSFGLVGEGSVEITAAVSDSTIQKKKFVESRLPDPEKEKFLKSSAKVQKDIIEKMVQKQIDKNSPRVFTSQRYIEIEDENSVESQMAQVRIKDAAQAAYVAFNSQLDQKKKSQGRHSQSSQGWQNNQDSLGQRDMLSSRGMSEERVNTVFENSTEQKVIQDLKTEINSLKEVISQFQKIPQGMNTSYPGSDYGLPFEVSFLFEKLVNEGLQPHYCAQILSEVCQKSPAAKFKNKSFLEGYAARIIMDTTMTSSMQSTDKTQVHLFVGPSGAGKTSTLVKMASHLLIKEKKKIGLITTDTIRVGAVDQLRIYAQILNVPFAVVRSTEDWKKLEPQFLNLDVVLVDFPAVSNKSEQVDYFSKLIPKGKYSFHKHLVVSSLSRFEDLVEMSKKLSVFNFDDLIVTNLDTSTKRGIVYSLMRELMIPLFAFGLGSRVPEDFEYATKERVIDLIFKLTQKSQAENSAR